MAGRRADEPWGGRRSRRTERWRPRAGRKGGRKREGGSAIGVVAWCAEVRVLMLLMLMLMLILLLMLMLVLMLMRMVMLLAVSGVVLMVLLVGWMVLLWAENVC